MRRGHALVKVEQLQVEREATAEGLSVGLGLADDARVRLGLRGSGERVGARVKVDTQAEEAARSAAGGLEDLEDDLGVVAQARNQEQDLEYTAQSGAG